MSSTQTYPRLFGKYALVAPLARGGMGELHLALSGQADLKKLCVIKQIIGHLSDREFVRRFVDEAKLVVKLSHQNLVPVFESGVEDGQYYLVMEYIEGRDLRAVWKTLEREGRPCPLPVALHIVKEICRGLSYAHTYGELELVHRDISPPNVLLSFSGEVRVTDFGLASSRLKLQKTAPGVLFGKLAYMAPEQARNEPFDARTDLYAVGVIFWELVTGKRLFPRKGSQLDQLKRAANPTFERPSKVCNDLPAAIDLIARRALAPNREDRYPDAEAMRRDIAGLLAKIAPTTDASAVASFLLDLYGDSIDRERKTRAAQLEQVAPLIRKLREEAANKARRFEQTPTAATADEDEGEDLVGAEETPPPALAPDTLLGDRYRIDAMLREGGMGTVYSATHTGIDKLVAVKVLHPLYSRMPEVVSRFRREARAASRIGHPNIIEVFDSGETEDGSIYFVMEHLVGQDLGDLIDEAGPLPIERVLGIAGQICQAVGAAHEAGIVHRDLKPENVYLVPREGQVDFVKVLDFGIAQSAHLEESRKERLTHPGMAMGTPEYMSPEQAAGKACDQRADIYAVGAIMYEMLSGRPPHDGDNVLEVLSAKAKGEIPPLRDQRPDVPMAIDRIITWTLAHDPQERPQTMGHLAYELTKLTSGRAGAVASMLGLADLSPSQPMDLSVLDEARPSAHVRGSSPTTVSDDQGIEGSTTSPTRPATAEVIRPPSRRKTSAGLSVGRVLIVVALLVGMGIAFYLLGRESRGPGGGTGSARAVATKGSGDGLVNHSVTPERTSTPLQPAPRPAAPRQLAPRLAATRPATAATRPATAATRPATAATRPAAPRSTTQLSTPGSRAVNGVPATVKRDPLGRRLLLAGRRHLKKGRFATARVALKAASHHKRYRVAALLGLAEVAFQTGDYQAAAKHAANARRRGGGWRAELALANYRLRLNRLTQAAAGYRRVLAKKPTNREAKRGLARTEKLLERSP
ncbi:MAG: hypothetical protein CSA24_02020 [Deltaproteobacteria bacterium]|nr:MAG: hypothetical protein CSB49_03315 [Pseudomonadota bacterium]PIE65776.1 MAG: hypothetical protein CSA24_02020 [Deltaproteobacteria bacterium]